MRAGEKLFIISEPPPSKLAFRRKNRHKTYLDYLAGSDYKESRKRYHKRLWMSDKWRINNAIYPDES